MPRYQARHYKAKIERMGAYICKELKAIQDEKPGDPWHKFERRSTLQEMLQAMKGFNIISDYNITKAEVTVRTCTEEPL